jgi:hypothetical protein
MKTRKRFAISLRVGMMIFGAVFILFLGARVPVHGVSEWSFVTIPDLPSGASLGRLWTDGPCNLYVWARKTQGTTDVPDAFLYHWDGRLWTQVLHLSAHDPQDVFGTGPADIFAAACSFPEYKLKMYHYDGAVWTEQLLPIQIREVSGGLQNIVGEPGNVYAKAFWPESFILKYDGFAWVVDAQLDDARELVYINSDEIYAQWGFGHYLWNGSEWKRFGGSCFCDANVSWGMRDTDGKLHLYTAGNRGFGVAVRVWRFTETSPGSMNGSWASVFADPDNEWVNAGTATDIWGAGPNDIYVTGVRRDAPGAQLSGRVYHFNGTTWMRISSFGNIANAHSVWGTGPDDVWICLADGRLLHYGPLVMTVDIDIHPGSSPNPINLGNKGNVPVAILSTNCFNAIDVNPETVLFADASPVKWSKMDVNQDGYIDLLLQFQTKDLNLTQTSTEATLTGETMNGKSIKGTDTVKIVPAKNK